MAIPAHSTGTGAKSGETERRAKREVAGAASAPAFAQPRRVLAPVDFSAMSFQALEYAGALALWFKASLCLVHTVETATQLNDLDNVTLMMSEQEITAKALGKLKRLARAWQARGLEVECRVVKGRAYVAICEAAQLLGADLIVIATHGYTGFKKALLGSTTERVVQHAPCPVLVMRSSHRTEPPAIPEGGRT